MMISTILLIANLAALVLNGVGFMNFWWNFWAYLIELGIYLLTFIIIIVLGELSK